MIAELMFPVAMRCVLSVSCLHWLTSNSNSYADITSDGFNDRKN